MTEGQVKCIFSYWKFRIFWPKNMPFHELTVNTLSGSRNEQNIFFGCRRTWYIIYSFIYMQCLDPGIIFTQDVFLSSAHIRNTTPIWPSSDPGRWKKINGNLIRTLQKTIKLASNQRGRARARESSVSLSPSDVMLTLSSSLVTHKMTLGNGWSVLTWRSLKQESHRFHYNCR